MISLDKDLIEAFSRYIIELIIDIIELDLIAEVFSRYIIESNIIELNLNIIKLDMNIDLDIIKLDLDIIRYLSFLRVFD